MNLLFTTPSFRKWGGADEVVVMLAEYFCQRGHRIVIASEDTPATLQGRFSAAGVHYPLPLKQRAPWTVARNVVGIMQIVRRERIDLISSHEKKTSALCMPSEWVLGVPVVHTAHTQVTNWRASWFGNLGRHVVANSETTRDYLIRALHVRQENIAVIFDAPRLMPAPSPADVERVRAELGIALSQPVLVCLGRLAEDKGHAVLLQAMLAIRREFQDVRLLIVGKGHLRRSLLELTQSLGLDGTVTFMGYRDDVSAILGAATLAVHPSVVDAVPFTNMECLRLGTPVVTTAVGGISEVIRDGETGILVPPHDPAALAEAVCRALRDPATLRALTERGRKEVLRRFDPAVMCEQYQEYFAQVLRRSLHPGAGGRAHEPQAGMGAACQ